MYFPAAVILQPDETLPSWIRHFVLSNAIYYGIKKSAASTDSWKRRCLFFGYFSVISVISVIKKVRYITNVTFYR